MSPSISTVAAPAGAAIAGFGHYRPERVVTNDDLAQVMETNDEWIRSRVGISERRFGGAEDTVVTMGAKAGEEAIAAAGLTPADIDLVIVATCTHLVPISHAATQVARELGIHAPGSFDINAACAGFCYGLALASQAVKSGAARNVLLVGSEKLTDSVDPVDRATAIIFADGAGAAVITGSDTDEIGPVSWGSDENHTRTIGTTPEGYIYQEGQAVFRWATTAIAPVAIDAVAKAGLELADIEVLVTHQANLRIVEAIAKKLIKAGARPDLIVADDIVTTGNTSSGSIPIAAARMLAEGKIRSGQLALAVGFGAGLTYAGQVFRIP